MNFFTIEDIKNIIHNTYPNHEANTGPIHETTKEINQ